MKTFYTDKLGFVVRNDVSIGEAFEGAGAGFRWLTVGPPEQPGFELIIADCAMGHDHETAEQLRALVAKGAVGAGVMETDDCHKAYEALSERGVVFLQPPPRRAPVRHRGGVPRRLGQLVQPHPTAPGGTMNPLDR